MKEGYCEIKFPTVLKIMISLGQLVRTQSPPPDRKSNPVATESKWLRRSREVDIDKMQGWVLEVKCVLNTSLRAQSRNMSDFDAKALLQQTFSSSTSMPPDHIEADIVTRHKQTFQFSAEDAFSFSAA